MKSEEEIAAERQAEFKIKCLTEAGLSYTTGAVLLVLLSLVLSIVSEALKESGAKDFLLYLGYAASQLAFFGAALLYFLRSKEPVRRMTPKFHWKYLPIAVALQFGLLFSLSRLNDFFLMPFQALGYHASEVELPALSGWNLIPALLVIALLPAVFEEVLFRGILARNLHRSGWGLWAVCLVSGAMFSLYHTSPEQTLYQFCCGICFSLVAIRAGSILPTMLAHFLNNAAIILMTAFGLGDLSVLPAGGYLALMILSAISLVASLVYLIFFDKSGNQRGKTPGGAMFVVAAGGGILVCGIEWIAALIMGFYA